MSLSKVPGPSRHEASESSCRPLQWPSSVAKPRPQATPSLLELRLSVLRPDQGRDEESSTVPDSTVEGCVGENLASDSTPCITMAVNEFDDHYHKWQCCTMQST